MFPEYSARSQGLGDQDTWISRYLGDTAVVVLACLDQAGVVQESRERCYRGDQDVHIHHGNQARGPIG